MPMPIPQPKATDRTHKRPIWITTCGPHTVRARWSHNLWLMAENVQRALVAAGSIDDDMPLDPIIDCCKPHYEEFRTCTGYNWEILAHVLVDDSRSAYYKMWTPLSSALYCFDTQEQDPRRAVA